MKGAPHDLTLMKNEPQIDKKWKKNEVEMEFWFDFTAM